MRQEEDIRTVWKDAENLTEAKAVKNYLREMNSLVMV